VNCDFFSQGLFLNGLPGSGSCLRMSDNWLAGYTIGTVAYEFTISIVLEQLAGNLTNTPDQLNVNGTNAASGNASLYEILTLSPAALVATNANETVSAELLGDLGGFQAMPTLETQILFIPIPNATQTDSGSPSLWPILQMAEVSQDGSECDKPGVSFGGFEGQPNRCNEPAGTCLSNQLQDIIDADAARADMGHVPLHNLGGLGLGSPSLRDAQPSASQPSLKRLALPCTQLRNSIVTLVINADTLRFVKTFSSGFIAAVQLVDFNGAAVGGFEALSGNGRLIASIFNNGTLNADFWLSVTNCSQGVALVPSPGALAVPAGGQLNQSWPLSVEDDHALNRSCTVVLQNARFVVIDTKKVLFYTTATVYDTHPVLSGGAGATGPSGLGGGAASCADECQLLNLVCAFENWCLTQLVEGLVIYAVLIGFAAWVFKGGPCRIAAALSKQGSSSRVAPRDDDDPPPRRRHRRREADEEEEPPTNVWADSPPKPAKRSRRDDDEEERLERMFAGGEGHTRLAELLKQSAEEPEREKRRKARRGGRRARR